MEHSIAPGRQTLTRMGPSTAPPFAAYHVFDHTRRRTGSLLRFAKIFLSLWIYNLVQQSNHRSEKYPLDRGGCAIHLDRHHAH